MQVSGRGFGAEMKRRAVARARQLIDAAAGRGRACVLCCSVIPRGCDLPRDGKDVTSCRWSSLMRQRWTASPATVALDGWGVCRVAVLVT
jgi:hypothetical protein